MKDTIIKNDKVVLVKAFEKLQEVGKEYEVANFTDDLLVLREIKTKVAICAIKYEDFDNYFVKKVDYTSNGAFTEWTAISNETGATIGWYRTNGKKTQVKIPTVDKNKFIRAESSCNYCDEYDFTTGVQIAYMKALKKSNNIIIKETTERLKLANTINDNYNEMLDIIIKNVKSKRG